MVYWDLGEREEKSVLGDINAFRLSATGDKVLVEENGRYHLLDVAPEQEFDEPLATGEKTARLAPGLSGGSSSPTPRD